MFTKVEEQSSGSDGAVGSARDSCSRDREFDPHSGYHFLRSSTIYHWSARIFYECGQHFCFGCAQGYNPFLLFYTYNKTIISIIYCSVDAKRGLNNI